MEQRFSLEKKRRPYFLNFLTNLPLFMEPEIQHWLYNTPPFVPCPESDDSRRRPPTLFPPHTSSAFKPSKWNLSTRFPCPESCAHYTAASTCHTTHPNQFPWFEQPNSIWWEVKIVKFLFAIFIQPPVNSSLLVLNAFFKTLPKTPSICNSPVM